jgi:hypothetical protein
MPDAYTNSTLTAGSGVVTRLDFQELRNEVK